MKRIACRTLTAAAAALAGCSADDAIPVLPPSLAACPAYVTVPASCYRGEGSSGAAYMIVMPEHWNRTLYLFNRGATPVPFDSARSLGAGRFLLADSVAVAASAYRSATPLARDAAEDTEDLRRIFVRAFGQPRRTVAHGVSFGGLVTARCAELYRGFDGAFAGCGLVAGALPSYYPLLDLRLVYQYYCRNLPRPEERKHDLFLGLDPQGAVTAEEVRSRLNECMAIALPALHGRMRRRLTRSRPLTTRPGTSRFPSSRCTPSMARACRCAAQVDRHAHAAHRPGRHVRVRPIPYGAGTRVPLQRDVPAGARWIRACTRASPDPSTESQGRMENGVPEPLGTPWLQNSVFLQSSQCPGPATPLFQLSSVPINELVDDGSR